jgi:hypothetical protein
VFRQFSWRQFHPLKTPPTNPNTIAGETNAYEQSPHQDGGNETAAQAEARKK